MKCMTAFMMMMMMRKAWEANTEGGTKGSKFWRFERKGDELLGINQILLDYREIQVFHQSHGS